MIERADQLVLEYVSKVADAAHGVLRTEQRLDFVRRLRDRIEEERRGSDDPATVRKVLGRFGDPAVLLRREIERLTAAGQPLAARPASARSTRTSGPMTGAGSGRVPGSTGLSATPPAPGGGGPAQAGGPPPTDAAPPADGPGGVTPGAAGEVSEADFDDSATQVLPVVGDAAPDEPVTAVQPPVPPVEPAVEPAASGVRSEEPSGPDGPGTRMRAGRAPLKGTWGAPPASMRRAPSSGAARKPLPPSAPRMARGATRGPVASGRPLGERLRRATGAADGRDVGTVLRNERREVAGMALLLLAGLLIPFPLPYVAIFPFPVLVWAVGALTVLASHGWMFKDRLTGLAAPILAYVVGGVVLGALRSPEEEGNALEAFTASFFHVSGLMFMFGAAGGVAWLGYRLLNPPPPPPRRSSPPGLVR
ncbi:hypothetical protein ABGB17_10400 [Sphaerisporangium sp. B11E5]|uniref:hypothetical protein n=1 Tax=Sphaerisporangium sp. B11E5 TaxID=3153563 RepID=UPI00325E857F